MDLGGHWVNQNGSTIELEVDDAGNLSGWYRSRKGRVSADKRYAVSGVQNGEVVAFQVDWRDDDSNLHAITSFTGRCVRGPDGLDEIHTVWVLARQYEDPEYRKPTGAWNAFLTNADVFRRQ